MVSIAVAAGVPPSASAMETAQRQLLDTREARVPALEPRMAGRGALRPAEAPPTHVQYSG